MCARCSGRGTEAAVTDRAEAAAKSCSNTAGGEEMEEKECEDTLCWRRRVSGRGEEENFPLGFVFFMKDAEYLPKSSGIMRRCRIRLENQNLLV